MTSSCSEPKEPAPSTIDLAVLKSWDFRAWGERYGTGQLPYRMDQLERRGIRLHWDDRMSSDEPRTGRLISTVRRAEALAFPFAQTALMGPVIRRSDATLAMFESEANFLAALRRAVPRHRRSPLIVISCWLSSVLAHGRAIRRMAYRWAYDSVDILYYLSENQGPMLAEMLDLSAERLRYLPFGVDTETFAPPPVEGDGGYVLAVGRDRARDWDTFFRAVRRLDLPVKVCCRPSELAGLEVPANVEVLGYVDRQRYQELIGRARVVAVLTRPVEYASGQSVLLEAMAMARPVVVSATPALKEYLGDGTACLPVPPGDVAAAEERIEAVARDEALRSRIGAAARSQVVARYSSELMWGTVADDLFRLTGARQ